MSKLSQKHMIPAGFVIVLSIIIIVIVRLMVPQYCVVCPDFNSKKVTDKKVLAFTIILPIFVCITWLFVFQDVNVANRYKLGAYSLVGVSIITLAGLSVLHSKTCLDSGLKIIDPITKKPIDSISPEKLGAINTELDKLARAQGVIHTQIGVLDTKAGDVATSSQQLESSSGFGGLNTSWGTLKPKLADLNAFKFEDLNKKGDEIGTSVKVIKSYLGIATVPADDETKTPASSFEYYEPSARYVKYI